MSAFATLVGAQTDRDRAAALLTAPVFDLIGFRASFRNACVAADFPAGVAYLDALFAACAKPCHRGVFSSWGLDGARQDLLTLIDQVPD
ncbi:hypothetical protein [Tianweitania sediminis]|uniref:Uncharacterized protein n=1 Tax=Tianweitania sediminis TaxID=1502156 RepID=A0A8J7R2D5_9HYPH|nr:hypothetical protein [Tianweitania sediminis]MBP0439603.1 hypothetical protein [Tianweitania sediminis]